MDDDYFNSALTSLKKPQEKRRLLQILVVIRKAVDETSNSLQPAKKLNEGGCVKSLLTCLQHENISVLDITLSILGNCCVEPSFARELIKLNILHHLNQVLEKRNSVDSVNGRVFRILGNLCYNIDSVDIMVKEPELIDKVASLLKMAARKDEDEVFNERISEASVTMALRFVRKSVKYSTIPKLVIKHDVMRALGLVLIKYTSLWKAKKQHENILQDILRLLLAISQYKKHYRMLDVVAALKNTENGNSLECLASLVLLLPSRVINIVMNLRSSASLKSDLPVPAIWENLLTALRTEPNDSVRKEYLECLCKLVDHPCHKVCLRLKDNLLQLLELLKNFIKYTDHAMDCCCLIVSILNKCHNDKFVAAEENNYGIIGILTDMLECVCRQSTVIKVPRHSKQKRRERSPPPLVTKKLKTSELPLDPYDMRFYPSLHAEERSTSPSECSEISSNGPNSPSYVAVAEEVSDSDNYSPVCSDAEDADMPTTEPLEIGYDASSDTSDEVMCRLPNHRQRMKYRLLEEINNLLIKYTRMRPNVIELANPKLLTLLMNCYIQSALCLFGWRPHNVVVAIVSVQDFLIPIMASDFIPMVYNAKSTQHPKNCTSCRNIDEMVNSVLLAFITTAESDCGKGNIAHQLLRSADVEMKQKLILSVPYALRTKQVMTKLMLNCGGLDILTKLLESSDLRDKSIKGLCLLAANHLKIKNPVNDKVNHTKKTVDMKQDSLSNVCENIVTFKLDDGTSVKADRDFLSEKNDYFNRLLCGSFKESEQSEITLQNVSSKSFKYLLHLLHEDAVNTNVVNINTDLETILDLLEITERYLMVDLNVYLAGCVEQLHLTSKTAPMIYQWSIESGTNILRVEVVAFALVADILESERLEMFRRLFDLGYSEQLIDDINKLLLRFLK